MFRKHNVHIQELLSGALVAFIMKVVAAGAVFGLNVMLARMLGADGSGIFFLAYTILLIVATIGRFGMDNALIRFIATSHSLGSIGQVLGVYQIAMVCSFVFAGCLSLTLYFLSPWISVVVFSKVELQYPLSVMALAVVPMALGLLHAFALQGLKKISEAVFILSVSIPILTCLLSFFLIPKYGINGAAWGCFAATIITLVLGKFFWHRQTSILSGKNYTPKFERAELFKSSFPLFGAAMMNLVILWSPMLFLGAWETEENLGVYSAANRTAMLTSFVLVAVNSIAAPKFAALYKQGEFEALQDVVFNSSKIMILFASPILLVFIFFPELILSVFGAEFEQGATVLVILAVGQFINVSTGLVGCLLMMSGHEALMRNNFVFCAIFGVILNMLLIPKYGILGAAVSGAFVLAMQNTIDMVLVWKKLRIAMIPLPAFLGIK